MTVAIRVSAYTVAVGTAQQLEMAVGEDRAFRLTFTDGGSAVDMTSAQAIVLTIRNPTNNQLVVARSYSGFVSGTGSGGNPYFQILQADTNSFADGAYVVDVDFTDSSGYKWQALVESPFLLLPRVGQPSDPLTTPPAVPVVYGLRWLGSWTTPSGGYLVNDSVTAQDGSLGATSVSSFRNTVLGNTLYPVNASLVPASGWQYVGQHGGQGIRPGVYVTFSGATGAARAVWPTTLGITGVNTNRQLVATDGRVYSILPGNPIAPADEAVQVWMGSSAITASGGVLYSNAAFTGWCRVSLDPSA